MDEGCFSHLDQIRVPWSKGQFDWGEKEFIDFSFIGASQFLLGC